MLQNKKQLHIYYKHSISSGCTMCLRLHIIGEFYRGIVREVLGLSFSVEWIPVKKWLKLKRQC